MSAKSFQRNSMNGLFPSLLNPESHQPSSSGVLSSNVNFSSDYSSAGQQRSHQNLGPESNSIFRHQRPVSEILRPENSISPETEALDKWFEDLQQYESSLESMATASLDPKYKEEVQHVDQWFRYLNEAERTATIYTLLQHSTQVQIRFFIAVLQQMSNKDPLGALLSPAHPEKVDMQAKLAGAMKKAELEASQKLLSVLPYQTGQVTSRPNANNIGRRNHIDRHSFALGDTNEYDRLFTRMPGSDFLNPNNGLLDDGILPQQIARNQHQQRTMFDTSSRPKSVIEGDLSSIFSGDWFYGNTAGGLASHQKIQQKQTSSVGPNRPKSADISSWSFGITSSVSTKSIREKDSLSSPWSGMSPTVSTFGDQQQQQQPSNSERPQSTSDVDQQLSMMTSNWNLNNNNSNNTNNRPVILSEDTKGFRRRAVNRTSIPGTVPETDERFLKNGMQSPPPPTPLALPNPANIVLSMYEENTTPASLLGSESNNPYYLIQPLHQNSRPTSRSASPVPSQSNSMNLFGNRTTATKPINKSQQLPKSQQQNYGQFLNPNDRIPESEIGYLSDHSDASNRSTGSKAAKKKNFNSGYHQARGGGGSVNNNNFGTAAKDKKNLDVVDMKLLEDVPAWLRSLRLHKYNPIFEAMKWQDMLKLDDEALLGKGVAALGARRKLLKVFDQVKAHCEANKTDCSC